MNIDFIRILEVYSSDPKLGLVVKEALKFIQESQPKSQHLSENVQFSHVLADLHRFRKENGFYREENLQGLDETIISLGQRDVEVRLGTIEMDAGFIALWLTSEENSLVGIFVVRPS